jgi:uncharacterized phage-associated protein
MIPYQTEKIENAICFFAFDHRKKTKKPLHQTFLYKYLAFLDFEAIKETGHPVLGLKYKAMKWGPVPEEIYNKKDNYKTPLFVFQKNSKEDIEVIPKKKPDLQFFSKYEIGLMEKLIEIFADKFIYTGLISDASHEAILAWKRTWHDKPNSIIDYRLTFTGEILLKQDAELTYPEENYLIYNALEN